MILYRIKSTGIHVGTKKAAEDTGEPFEKIDVDTAKDALIEYLNKLVEGAAPADPEDHQDDNDGITAEAVTPVSKPAKLSDTDSLGQTAGWLSNYRQESFDRGASLNAMVNLEGALMSAPLEVALRLNTLVAERLRDFATKKGMLK